MPIITCSSQFPVGSSGSEHEDGTGAVVWHRKTGLGQLSSPLSAWLTCPSAGTKPCTALQTLLLPQTLPSNPSLPSAICIYCSENRDYSQALILPPLETFLVPRQAVAPPPLVLAACKGLDARGGSLGSTVPFP